MHLRSTLLATICCAVSIWGADLPLGHPDFLPTPDRPVGFRGDGTGFYPGATLVDGFNEQTGKNIVWKTEMPSWGNGGAIVVGDKIISTGEPWFVFCHSIVDGKLLWQRELNPFVAAGLSGQELADAVEQYEVVAMVRLLGYYLLVAGGSSQGTVSAEEMVKKRAFLNQARWQQAYRYLDRLKQTAQRWAPQSATGFDELAALYRRYQESGETSMLDGKKRGSGVEVKLGGTVVKALPPSPKGVPQTHVWYPMVGFTYATPVSDGEKIYVSMGQGQIGCFDLKGTLVWQIYVNPGDGKHVPELRVNHVPSPLLVGDRLVVQTENSLIGLDKATGKVVWKDEQQVKGGYNCGNHRVLRLPIAGAAKRLPVIVTTSGRVLRAEDGKLLCAIPARMCGSETGGMSVPAIDDVVVFEQGGNNGGDWKGFRLTVPTPDTVLATELWAANPLEMWKIKSNNRFHTIMLPNAFIKAACYPTRSGGMVYDPRTGKVSLEFPCVRSGSSGIVEWGGELGGSSIMVGDRILLGNGGGDGRRRNREDGKIYVMYAIAGLDGKIINQECILGGDNIPRYPLMEKYMPEWYAEKPMWHEVLPAQFSHSSSSFIAQGNRLYFRSTSHLYCIGTK